MKLGILATFCLVLACEANNETPESIRALPVIEPLNDVLTTPNHYWTSWTDDDGSPARCRDGDVAAGMQCRGTYCDEIRLACVAYPHALNKATWTPSIMTGQRQIVAKCAPGARLTGIVCQGADCDNIRLRCQTSKNTAEDCSWARLILEESAPFVADKGQFLGGVKCLNGYCNYKTPQVCRTSATDQPMKF